MHYKMMWSIIQYNTEKILTNALLCHTVTYSAVHLIVANYPGIRLTHIDTVVLYHTVSIFEFTVYYSGVIVPISDAN